MDTKRAAPLRWDKKEEEEEEETEVKGRAGASYFRMETAETLRRAALRSTSRVLLHEEQPKRVPQCF